MSEGFDGAWEQIGVSAALAKSYASDQGSFLPMLVGLLEGALPESLEVERKPIRFLSKDKRVVLVRLHLGDDTYMLQQPDPDGRLVCWHAKTVRGITLQTEEIRLDRWLSEVGAIITERARESETAALALKNFMEVKNL
ncbi:MAG TPA: hypothetical protein VFW40_00845 [Capsulimonadaceae bacterium]|nr:hypothetical protein [Capsulimonadaceae bacterium]